MHLRCSLYPVFFSYVFCFASIFWLFLLYRENILDYKCFHQLDGFSLSLSGEGRGIDPFFLHSYSWWTIKVKFAGWLSDDFVFATMDAPICICGTILGINLALHLSLLLSLWIERLIRAPKCLCQSMFFIDGPKHMRWYIQNRGFRAIITFWLELVCN